MYALQGKIRPTWHVRFPCQSMYTWRTLPADDPHTWQHFASHQQHWTNPTAPEKKGSRHNPQPGWVIHRSTTQFLSQHNHWSSNKSQTSVNNRLLGLPGLYHRHAIGTFNAYLRGPTHRSLIDTGAGYNLGGVRLPHTTLQPFQLVVSPFHLRAPLGLQFNQELPSKSEFEFKNLCCHVVFWSLGHLPWPISTPIHS
jgi:hypothetical protein